MFLLLKNLGADLALSVLAALIALGAGVAANVARQDPLPLVYETLYERVDRVIAESSRDVGFATAMAQISEATLEEALQLHQDKAALFIDARETTDWSRAHIAGALSLSVPEFARLYGVAKDTLEQNHGRRILVYCSGSDCGLSRQVAILLTRLGHPRVGTLPAGWEGWMEVQGPTEAAPVETVSADYTSNKEGLLGP